MFQRQTVFVIGAGASFELGLPAGSELKDRIANLLNITFQNGYQQSTGDPQIAEILKRRSRAAGLTDWNYLLAKCWMIRDALPGSLSIDNLLDAHRADPDVSFIGKLGIAKAILAAERNSKLYRKRTAARGLNFSDLAGTWLVPLFQLLSEGVSKDDAKLIFSNVSFVIFNYDRCIERFIPEALRLYYGFNIAEAEEIASTAQIIHPYGRVGKPGASDNMYGVSFGSDDFDLETIAEGIRTFCEGTDETSPVFTALRTIGEADQVIFLGFAFHPLNMELLKAPEGRSTLTSHIFATTYGLSKPAVRVVRSLLNQTFNKIGAPGESKDFFSFDEVNLDEVQAHEFLQEHFRALV